MGLWYKKVWSYIHKVPSSKPWLWNRSVFLSQHTYPILNSRGGIKHQRGIETWSWITCELREGRLVGVCELKLSIRGGYMFTFATPHLSPLSPALLKKHQENGMACDLGYNTWPRLINHSSTYNIRHLWILHIIRSTSLQGYSISTYQNPFPPTLCL